MPNSTTACSLWAQAPWIALLIPSARILNLHYLRYRNLLTGYLQGEDAKELLISTSLPLTIQSQDVQTFT